MTITLNHTIVSARDKDAAARFFAEIFGLRFEGLNGHFAPVRVNDTLTLDFADAKGTIASQHYAFHVSDAEFDAILLPTVPDAAPLLAELGPYFSSERPPYMRPFNLTGQSALSVCNGFDSKGLPLSLQIVGRHFDEATVLRIGHAYERATTWRERRPQL